MNRGEKVVEDALDLSAKKFEERNEWAAFGSAFQEVSGVLGAAAMGELAEPVKPFVITPTPEASTSSSSASSSIVSEDVSSSHLRPFPALPPHLTDFKKESMEDDCYPEGEEEDPSMEFSSDNPSLAGMSVQEMQEYLYRERRKKNNEAAKRSRDARHSKGEATNVKLAVLEKENIILKTEYAMVSNDIKTLKALVYNLGSDTEFDDE